MVLMEKDKQTAILIGVNSTNQKKFNEEMEELANLAEACEIEVAASLTQNLDHPSAKYYVGKGKLEEIKAALENEEANLVIFNAELSPSQLRNIEKALEAKIIDRTMLILEIFSIRAQTKEAMLQIAIAKLQYFLPRLVGLRASLGRQSGGVGVSNKGAGEQKIELDRRKIKADINALEKELKKVVSERKIQRQWRKKQNMKTVALVGYTNAGKSSVMNNFISAYRPDEAKEVFIKDMLFATLETTARRIDLPHHLSFLLTDTVGFVSNLPHHLVEAFKSTLEEIKEADLLLHVVDISNERATEMMQTTTDTLRDLGAIDIPTIYIYNKSDQLTPEQIETLQLPENAILYSAKEMIDFDALVSEIKEQIFDNYTVYSLLIPYEHGDVTAFYHENVEVLSEDFEAEGTRIHIYATEPIAYRFKKKIIEIAEVSTVEN